MITKVPPTTESGNMATAIDVYRVVDEGTRENDFQDTLEQIPPEMSLYLRQPVFAVGEILILDQWGREVGYPGRKPSKWNVECEHYGDLGQAVRRAIEIFEQQLREEAAKDES